jgi:hypothetical protein
VGKANSRPTELERRETQPNPKQTHWTSDHEPGQDLPGSGRNDVHLGGRFGQFAGLHLSEEGPSPHDDSDMRRLPAVVGFSAHRSRASDVT